MNPDNEVAACEMPKGNSPKVYMVNCGGRCISPMGVMKHGLYRHRGAAVTAGKVFEEYAKEYLMRIHENVNIEFVLDVVELAKSFLDPNFWWLQVRNPYLQGQNREFVADCLQYILTGERQVNIESRARLLDYYECPPSPMRGTVLRDDRLAFWADEYYKHMSTQPKDHLDTVISDWCRSGFGDMLCSLHIMFDKPVQTS